MTLRKSTIVKIALGICLCLAAVILNAARLPKPIFKDDYSTVVLDENGEYLRVFLNKKQQWQIRPGNEKIPEKLIEAAVLFEDKRFFSHKGVDFAAIARAGIQNTLKMDKVSGASTITMQVARLIKPKRRSFGNKIIEMIQAVKLEMFYSKKEILSFYFNNAPYGGNIIGYHAASLKYFGKEPRDLTWAEAATLAVLPNRPGLISPLKSKEKLKVKRDRLLKRMFEEKFLDEETLNLAIFEPIPEKVYPFTFMTPQLADKIERTHKGETVKTTISKNMQAGVKKIIDEYMVEMKRKGVNNCSAIVVETKSGAIKACIGSNDYYDDKNSGKIDGVRAKRSTGSILKPFLYALAMDRGLIIPETKLEDIPENYAGYSPYNASMSFQGLVSARNALAGSQNAPAVKLLNDYGLEEFYEFLKSAGVSTLNKTPKEYGLPIIIGGAETTLWDLARLYRGLGNYGNFSDIYVVPGEKPKDNILVSRGASYLTLDILKDLKRPAEELYWKSFLNQKKVAWKTGTSYGNKDAWTAGVSPEWTICVWIGNFDGKENSGIMGIDAAAPLFFKIFNYLTMENKNSWFDAPDDDLITVKISAETGYRATENTDRTIEALAPKSAIPLKYSPNEKTIFLNNNMTEEVCSLCWKPRDVVKIARVIYSPAVTQFLKVRGQSFYALPPHRKTCPTIGRRNPIEFIYPGKNSIIFVPRGVDGKNQKIIMKAADTNKGSKIFWYMDKMYLGYTINKHEKEVAAVKGWHKLQIVDAEGHSREISFYSELEKK